MEMPIQVIVVLFIALVVGGGIIAFSQRTLNNAQEDLNSWRHDPAKKDSVVEVKVATDTTVLGLANTCARENVGTVDKKICFVLFADTFTADWESLNETPLERNFTLRISAPNDSSAVRISYDPRGSILVT